MAEELGLRMITQEELNAILVEHGEWFESFKQNGYRADTICEDVKRPDLSYYDLSSKLFHSGNLSYANLEGAKLIKADLSGASLWGANLKGACLRESCLVGADLAEALLQEAELVGAHLEKASLQDAHLEGALLFDAYLAGSNFTMAHLEGALLIGAHLEGSNFSNADLRNTNLTDVTYDRHIKCRGVRLEGCYGSPRLKRFLEDQDYLEEFQERHPKSYFIWWLLADCGRSTLRWTAWALGLITVFSMIYGLLGPGHFKLPIETKIVNGQELNVVTGLAWGPVACVYYSVVTFSTLGFGDITPKSDIAACIVMAEVILGYIMLGGMISILANKLARRS